VLFTVYSNAKIISIRTRARANVNVYKKNHRTLKKYKFGVNNKFLFIKITQVYINILLFEF